MEVHFYGRYREIVGRKVVDFPVEHGLNLHALLLIVVDRFPALRDEILDGHGRLYPYLPLFLNGRNPRLLEAGINTAVAPQDVLSIFTPIASGKINVEDVNVLLSGENVEERHE